MRAPKSLNQIAIRPSILVHPLLKGGRVPSLGDLWIRAWPSLPMAAADGQAHHVNTSRAYSLEGLMPQYTRLWPESVGSIESSARKVQLFLYAIPSSRERPGVVGHLYKCLHAGQVG